MKLLKADKRAIFNECGDGNFLLQTADIGNCQFVKYYRLRVWEGSTFLQTVCLHSPYGPYSLYRALIPVQERTVPFMPTLPAVSNRLQLAILGDHEISKEIY